MDAVGQNQVFDILRRGVECPRCGTPYCVRCAAGARSRGGTPSAGAELAPKLRVRVEAVLAELCEAYVRMSGGTPVPMPAPAPMPPLPWPSTPIPSPWDREPVDYPEEPIQCRA